MGSEQSQTKTSKNQNILSGAGSNLNHEFAGRDLSSYKGVKTEYAVSSENCEDATNDTINTRNYYTENKEVETEKQREKEKKEETIEVMFVWQEGGNDIFITGSFAGWKQYFMLEKKDNYFYRKIPLSRGKHYFKFIVDKEWRYSNHYEKVSDENGNVNNVIDLSNFTGIKEESQESLKEKKKQGNSSLKKKRLNDDYNNYSEIFPDRSDLNSETPIIPNSYCSKFNLNDNSVQYKLGKKNYIAPLFYKIYYPSNNSQKGICRPPHINV